MRDRAQATLEFTIMFFVMVVLLLSLLTLWKKYTDKIVDRQKAYNDDRVYNNPIGTGEGPCQTSVYGDLDPNGPGA